MLDRFIGYIGDIVFAERGHQKIMEVMMLIKSTGESVKLIGSKYTLDCKIGNACYAG